MIDNLRVLLLDKSAIMDFVYLCYMTIQLEIEQCEEYYVTNNGLQNTNLQ